MFTSSKHRFQLVPIIHSSLSHKSLLCVWCLLGVTGVMIVETAVMNRAAHIQHAHSTSSPVRTGAASRGISSVTGTTTAGTNLMSWITCAGLRRPPAQPETSAVTTGTVCHSGRCVTGVMTATTTVTRKAVVSTVSCDQISLLYCILYFGKHLLLLHYIS